MNAKSPEAGFRLRDANQDPIRNEDCASMQYLIAFSRMVEQMKPPRSKRRPSGKTLTTDTANATVTSITGFQSLVQFLLNEGYQYVMLGRYTNVHIEK